MEANVRRGPPEREYRWALFSKRGFDDGLEDQLDDRWSLNDLTEIDDLLT